MFSLKNVTVMVGGKTVVEDFSLELRPGELHVLMGPNGSGKSSLAMALAGHKDYAAHGSAMLDEQELLGLLPEARRHAGLFVAFQKPIAIPGVATGIFLRTAMRTNKEPFAPTAFRKNLRESLARVGLAETVTDRELYVGFSGGEAKRLEIAQLSLLGARYAILDEPDSGLDLDGIGMVTVEVERQRAQQMGILFITHNPRVLGKIVPTAVHVMVNGQHITSGGQSLAAQIEKDGFAALQKN